MKHAAFPHTDGYRVGSASSAVPDSLSVVIPAHNEAGNIATLLQEVCYALRGRIEFEIVCQLVSVPPSQRELTKY